MSDTAKVRAHAKAVSEYDKRNGDARALAQDVLALCDEIDRQRWRSVRDEPPTHHVMVLGWHPYLRRAVPVMCDGAGWWRDASRRTDPPTHWMPTPPIPDLPKEPTDE